MYYQGAKDLISSIVKRKKSRRCAENSKAEGNFFGKYIIFYITIYAYVIYAAFGAETRERREMYQTKHTKN